MGTILATIRLDFDVCCYRENLIRTSESIPQTLNPPRRLRLTGSPQRG